MASNWWAAKYIINCNTMFIRKLIRKATSLTRYTLNDIRKPAVHPKGQWILGFHGVDDYGNTRINSRFVSAEKLDQLIALLKLHFRIVPVKEIFEMAPDATEPTLAITFDDGYRNVLTHALPVLERHQAPASVYITTVQTAGHDMLWPDCLDLSAYIDKSRFELEGETFRYAGKRGYRSVKTGLYLKDSAKKKSWAYKEEMMRRLPGAKDIRHMRGLDIYWQLLNADEIRTLATSPLITIGSHGQLHNCLAESTPDDALQELHISKNYLQEIIGREIEELAYPDASYTEALGRDALEMGFTRQLLGHYLYPESSSRPWFRDRFSTNPHLSVYNQLICITHRKYY